jgi:hypothetical protein
LATPANDSTPGSRTLTQLGRVAEVLCPGTTRREDELPLGLLGTEAYVFLISLFSSSTSISTSTAVTPPRYRQAKSSQQPVDRQTSRCIHDVDSPSAAEREEKNVYARVATFQGDPANVDEAISRVRGEVESGNAPPGLEGAKMLMLINRESGKGLGVTLFESEEAMRRGDEALNAMDPGGGGRRTSVEFYEVPVHTLG